MNPGNGDRDDKEQYADTIRSMIECENRMTNDRVTWLVTIQGLLFAALGFAWDKQDTRWLITALALLGATVSLSAWTSLMISNQARRDLVRWWDANKPAAYQGPDVIGTRAFTPGWERLMRPWRSLPFIFIAGWTLVLILSWLRP